MAQHKALESIMIEPKLDTQLASELWQEYYERHSRGWMTVVSGSMMPLIHISDRVLVVKITPENIRPGYLIAFQREDKFIVHRVLKTMKTKEGLLFIERGDAASAIGTFRGEDVIGRITVVKHDDSFLKLDSFSGNVAARGMAWWVRNIRPLIPRLYRPSHRLLLYPGRAISLPFRAVNKFVIHACRFTWSLCGRSAKNAFTAY